ncbi:MAG: CPBP family intramembrane metalloprotease [Deltaproteobacteria bacterium]|nr:CPBP family intramembrane metalloprotease [Deltaproteobacteria bacterium]
MYVALLGVQLFLMIVSKVTEDVFTAEVVGTVGFAVVTLAFYFPCRERFTVREPVAFPRYWYLLVVLAAVPIGLGVHAYVRGVSSLFGLHAPLGFEDELAHGWIWASVLIVVMPPLVEELAFRGVMFGALRHSLTVSETLIVTSFAFGLLHLSIPSLLTHIPLGFYFGWLRHRSGSLWPAVLAHACHNAFVLALVTV